MSNISEIFCFIFRNFRCDCGNKKFGDVKCKLYPVSIIGAIHSSSIDLLLV